jgi:hypothetical protein
MWSIPTIVRWPFALGFIAAAGAVAWLMSRPDALETTEASPTCASQVARAKADAAANPDAAVTELDRLIALVKSPLPVTDRERCRSEVSAFSSELARSFHARGAKTKRADALVVAERLYERHVMMFPDATDIVQDRYFHAEVMWSRAETEADTAAQAVRWKRAALAFTNVATATPIDPTLRKESAYAAVLAWKNAINAQPAAPEATDSEALTPTPLTVDEQQMLASFDVYFELADANDDDAVGMRFLKANLYRRHDQLDVAIPLFRAIIDQHPEHEVSEYAANLALDSYNRLGRIDELLALTKSLIANKRFLDNKPDLKALLHQIATSPGAMALHR